MMSELKARLWYLRIVPCCALLQFQHHTISKRKEYLYVICNWCFCTEGRKYYKKPGEKKYGGILLLKQSGTSWYNPSDVWKQFFHCMGRISDAERMWTYGCVAAVRQLYNDRPYNCQITGRSPADFCKIRSGWLLSDEHKCNHLRWWADQYWW